MAEAKYTIQEIMAMRESPADKSLGALKENWIFVIAMFGIGWWVITSTFSLQAGVIENARGVESAKQSIAVVQVQLDEVEKIQNSSSALTQEILTTVQLIQRDIADLKTR